MTDIRSELFPGPLVMLLVIGGLLGTGQAADLVQSTLSEAQQTAAVDKHNTLRRQEHSANMQYMLWNSQIAAMAQTWANTCKWAHGQPNGTGQLHDKLGQNLFFITGSAQFDVDSAIQSWYEEKKDYIYDDSSCKPGKVCGHYTQVVWASSTEVGCGFRICPVLAGPRGSRIATNATYFVCNYGPPGNLVGKRPYVKGKPCTRCDSGVFMCYQDLCVDDCTKAKVPCTCQAECENCGKKNDNCTCSCVSGWMGVSCHEKCRDLDHECMHSLQPQACHVPMVVQKCPAMCKVCGAEDACKQPSTTTSSPELDAPVAPPRLPSADECFCLNGGTQISRNNTQCKCSCLEENHGTFCQYSREETAIGVTLFIAANKTQWPAIKKAIDPSIVKELIRLCHQSQNTCCPDASNTWIRTAMGYPTDLGMSANQFRVTIFAFYALTDPSCGKHKGNTTRRADDSKSIIVYVPQKRLLEAITNIQPHIDNEMEKCCHAKLTDVRPAQLDDEIAYHGNNIFGLPIWAVGIIAVGCLIGLFLFVMVLVVVCRRKKKAPGPTQRNGDMETTVNL